MPGRRRAATRRSAYGQLFRVSATSHICSSCSGSAARSPHTVGDPDRGDEGCCRLPASQKGSDTPTAACVRACVRLGKVAERCTCVSSVPRVNILSQLHCTSSCVKGAPSVHMRRRMLDLKKTKTERISVGGGGVSLGGYSGLRCFRFNCGKVLPG